MKGIKQKKSIDTCLQIDRAEPELYAGGQTYIWITENNITNASHYEFFFTTDYSDYSDYTD
jgi:hypothetical protein